jgi:hypothetical protein
VANWQRRSISCHLHPDAGISFGYEGWDIKLKDGTQLVGIVASKTETDVVLKMPGGIVQNQD